MKKDKNKNLLVEQFKKTPIVQFSCEKLDIGRASYYRWRKEDEDFAKAADEALVEGSFFINDMAESQLISAIKDRNLTAIIFWLRNHHKAYTDKLEIKGRLEHSIDELSPEEKVLLETALKLALPKEDQKKHGKRKPQQNN